MAVELGGVGRYVNAVTCLGRDSNVRLSHNYITKK